MKKQSVISPAKWIAVNGMLAAAAIVLSAAENLIPPLPMMPPGTKIGLSNIVTMFAAGSSGLWPALCIAVIKGLFNGLTRGVTSMLMSLSGGILSTFIMWLAFRKFKFGLMGVGVLGAFFHNAAQLLVAVFMTSPTVVWYAPMLILMSVITGILTGLVLKCFLPLLKKIRRSDLS